MPSTGAVTTGGVSPSSTIDSSSYTIGAGQSVTFTARVLGSSGTPTGSMSFRAGSAVISGCGAVAVADGQAKCTTSSLAAGSHPITGIYSGDRTYSAGTAGPITQTVTGSASSSASFALTIDSSSYTSRPGQPVTFTVAVTGNSPTGNVDFQDNGTTISGCARVPLSGGIARCTTSSLSAGTHPIRGWYYGDSRNSAGIAGPITQTVR
jgi:hypothetical protein